MGAWVTVRMRLGPDGRGDSTGSSPSMLALAATTSPAGPRTWTKEVSSPGPGRDRGRAPPCAREAMASALSVDGDFEEGHRLGDDVFDGTGHLLGKVFEQVSHRRRGIESQPLRATLERFGSSAYSVSRLHDRHRTRRGIAGLAEDRLDARVRVLRVARAVAVEADHAIDVEDVVLHAIAREIGVLDRADADHPRVSRFAVAGGD